MGGSNDTRGEEKLVKWEKESKDVINGGDRGRLHGRYGGRMGETF